MKQEKSAGAIVFYAEKGKPLYLMIKSSYWGLVKGWVEQNESEEETAMREAKEEAGLDIKILPGFKEVVHFVYKFKDKLIKKKVVFFIGEAESKEVRLSFEHSDFEWLSIQEALERTKFKNQREILKKAHAFVSVLLKQKTLF